MRTTLPRPAGSLHVIATARVPVRPRPSPPAPPVGRGLLTYWFVTPVQTRPTRVALAEGGYLGVTLLIGGLLVLLGQYWFVFTEAATASLLAVLAVVSGGLGLVVAGGPRNLPMLAIGRHSRRRAVAGSLFAVTAGCAAGAAGVLADGHAWLAGGAVGLVVAVIAYLTLPTVTGLVVGIGFGALLLLSTVDEMSVPTPLTVGFSLLGLGTLIATLSVAGLIRQRELGLSLGALIALAGAQQPMARPATVSWAGGLTLAVGVACLAIYRELPVTVLLPAGVAGVSVAVLETTWQHTSGPVGAGVTLVATGVALIVSSAVGLQLWRAHGEARPVPHS
jgi:hypothetical protein